MIRLTQISVLQTSKMLGALYAVLGLVYVPFLLLAPTGGGSVAAVVLIALGMPLLMGAFGFVFGVIACATYNFLAEMLGGFEFRLDSGQGE